jgi:glycosyltransferase involved in cell wall biosynthesis
VTLRVGVSAARIEADARSGHGRVWLSTLAALGARVRVMAVHVDRLTAIDYSVPVHGFDVWLADGHGGKPITDVPVVAVVHEMAWTPAQLRGLDESSGYPLAIRTAAGVGSASHVIVPSESSRRQVLDRSTTAPDRVHTVPYGVDSAVFRPDARGGRALVARHAETPERPYVLFVGSLHPRKNLAVLRDAMGALAAAGRPHVLAVVVAEPRGSLPSIGREAAAAALPGAPGRVVVVPSPADADLAALMAGADAFCMPSLGEGFGLPALEAMACGTVVVVSDRDSLPEVVGDGGLVVAPTADALEASLDAVLARPAEFARLRERAVARAQRFRWDRTAHGWADVLERAAGRHHVIG